MFVSGEHGGISHTPREYSTPAACANGTDVLANAVLRLADQPAPKQTNGLNGSSFAARASASAGRAPARSER